MHGFATTDFLTDTSGLIEELDMLNAVDLEPELPDISEPSSLLTEFLETMRLVKCCADCCFLFCS